MDSRLLPNTGETQVKGNTKLKVPHSEKPSFQFLDLVIWLESIRVVSEAFAVSESALNFFSVVSANHMALSVFNPNINPFQPQKGHRLFYHLADCWLRWFQFRKPGLAQFQ